ncbi:unnamed protein product [Mycena citricolor]|uniref:DUF7029 domain-containing protein n=1 Tax=Mycena citricolor TaxID=2018698 RepID=A0AAD2HS53_9AGAR|nr:unnamed protein product [Mycena citricolor]
MSTSRFTAILITTSVIIHTLLAHASPTFIGGAYREPRSSDLTTLHPTLHPNDDPSDLNNLKGDHHTALYYAASPDSAVQGAALIHMKHRYPTVLVERSHFVSSVTCDAASSTITVRFSHPAAYDTAKADWAAHKDGFFLVSYVPGCGAGTTSSERSFHLVSGTLKTDDKQRTIECLMETVPIHDTVHPNEEIRVHAATYTLEKPKSPYRDAVHVPHMVQARDLVVTQSDLSSRGFSFGDIIKIAIKINPVLNFAVNVVGKLIKFNEHPKKTGTFRSQDVVPWKDKFKKPNDSYLLYEYPPKKPGSGKKSSSQAAGGSSSASKNATSTTTKSIQFFCSQCGVRELLIRRIASGRPTSVAEATIRFSANIVGTVADGFTQADVQLDADVNLRLVLGIKATYTYKDKKELDPIGGVIPGAGLEVPKVLKLGPEANVVLGIDYSIKLEGMLEAGFECAWKGVGAKLDFKDASNSGMIGTWDLSSACHPVFVPEAALTITVSPFIRLEVALTASLFPVIPVSFLTGKAAMNDQVSLVLEGSVSTKAGKCAALQPRFTGKLKNELYVTALKFKPLQLLNPPLTFPLFDECVGKASSSSSSSSDSGSADESTPGGSSSVKGGTTTYNDDSDGNDPSANDRPGGNDGIGRRQDSSDLGGAPDGSGGDDPSDAGDPSASADPSAAGDSSAGDGSSGASDPSTSDPSSSGATSDNDPSPAASSSDDSGSGSGTPIPTNLQCEKARLQMDWIVEGSVVVTRMDGADPYNGWVSQDGLTYGTAPAAAMVLYTVPTQAGTGKLVVAASPPDGGVQLYFYTADDVRQSLNPYAVALDPGDPSDSSPSSPVFYYTALCLMADGTSHVFLTTNPAQSEGELAQSLADLTGGSTSCGYFPFTQYMQQM